MGELRSSDKIDEDSDFFYNGLDCNSFPACRWCASYTPFLFYVTSASAMASFQGMLDPKLNVFCAECLPMESNDEPPVKTPFYDMGCLFNSPEIVSLFRGYRYNNPYYRLYRNVDRIVITEHSKISPKYKQLLGKSIPKLCKMRKLQQLFPSVHQMPFQKHADAVAMLEALRKKSLEIWHFYTAGNTTTLLDNYDVLVNRSPLPLSQRTDRRFPSDTLTLRETPPAEDSLSEVNSISITQNRSILFSDNSVSVRSVELTPSTQGSKSSQAALPNIHSQSFISSQSLSSVNTMPILSENVEGEEPMQVQLETIPEPYESFSSSTKSKSSQAALPNIHLQSVISSQSLSSVNTMTILSESVEGEEPMQVQLETIPEPYESFSSSTASDQTRITVTPRRKSPAVIHDSQEAGPSGLQQQQPRRGKQQQQQQQRGGAQPRSKRRRSPPPMNPSPSDFRPELAGARTPRLHGG